MSEYLRKIIKRGEGVQITFGGQNIPENCMNLQKTAFLKFQIQKINKRGGANNVRRGGVKKFSKKNKTSPPRLFGSREYGDTT